MATKAFFWALVILAGAVQPILLWLYFHRYGQRRERFVLLGTCLFAFSTLMPHAIRAQDCPKTMQDCPTKGCGGDPLLNVRKNRTDKPTKPEEWALSDIISLNEGSPTGWGGGNRKTRKSAKDLGEGTPLVVTGYLIHAQVWKTPETCNYLLKGTANNDFHLNLVERKGMAMNDSVVVEITPRLRPAGWKIEKLRPIPDEPLYVRVTGWLLFDSQHASFAPMPRGTAWEIQPVTNFEVCTAKSKSACDKGKGWKPLEEY